MKAFVAFRIPPSCFCALEPGTAYHDVVISIPRQMITRHHGSGDERADDCPHAIAGMQETQQLGHTRQVTYPCVPGRVGEAVS